MVFLAGFIDSIAGGGGLISLTSYMACGLPATACLGTNKFSAIVGGSVASANYVKTKNFDIIRPEAMDISGREGVHTFKAYLEAENEELRAMLADQNVKLCVQDAKLNAQNNKINNQDVRIRQLERMIKKMAERKN